MDVRRERSVAVSASGPRPAPVFGSPAPVPAQSLPRSLGLPPRLPPQFRPRPRTRSSPHRPRPAHLSGGTSSVLGLALPLPGGQGLYLPARPRRLLASWTYSVAQRTPDARAHGRPRGGYTKSCSIRSGGPGLCGQSGPPGRGSFASLGRGLESRWVSRPGRSRRGPLRVMLVSVGRNRNVGPRSFQTKGKLLRGKSREGGLRYSEVGRVRGSGVNRGGTLWTMTPVWVSG